MEQTNLVILLLVGLENMPMVGLGFLEVWLEGFFLIGETPVQKIHGGILTLITVRTFWLELDMPKKLISLTTSTKCLGDDYESVFDGISIVDRPFLCL